MTDALFAAALDLVNTPPAWAAAACLVGIYLTLWKARDKKVRLMLLHSFLVGFLCSLGFWAVDIALMRATALLACFKP